MTTQASPDKAMGKHWQDGPRAMVKGAALAGDAQAEAVFLAHAHQRADDPGLLPVCYRQTVKGAPLSPAQRQKYDALSPAAKTVAQAAAALGGDFHRNVMPSIPGGSRVSRNDWDALHEAGILKDGQIAGHQVHAFMRRETPAAFREELAAIKATLQQRSSEAVTKTPIRRTDALASRVRQTPSPAPERALSDLSGEPLQRSAFGSLARRRNGS